MARDRAEDETLTGTTSTITKRPIEDAESKTEEKKQEGEKETPDSEKTEEEFIAEKVRNAYKFEENQCIVCMQRNNSFEEYVILPLLISHHAYSDLVVVIT